MANPSVTYTFTNSTTADGTQVSQNFTDLINGMTDGTKSFSIDALTVGGAALFNGAVTLGNASGDDVTFTGSLSSSIPVKTDSAFDIGDATHALRVAYLDKIQGGSTAGCEQVGRTDGSGPSATMIGYEYVSYANATGSAAGSYATVCTLVLSAGVYDICATVFPSATVGLTICTFGVSTETNALTGAVLGKNRIDFICSATGSVSVSASMSPYRHISSGETLYLTVNPTGASPSIYANFRAVRIA